MDVGNKNKRSKVMSKIKSKDTKPELIVRHFLYSKGYRYRKNVKELPGTPDIVLRKYRIVIFINGCFWHGHEKDGHIPHSNKEYWKTKIEKNKKRDIKNKDALKKLGWKVMTIWECQLKKAIRENTLNGIIYLINKSYLDELRIKTSNSYLIKEMDCPSIAAEEKSQYFPKGNL